jgi:hypothetical protein
MRHVNLLRLALLAACLVGPATLAADAALRCTPPAVDLGEIHGGPARQHSFELLNDGKETIEIVKLQRGCGCLTPELDRRTLRPGEKASLLVALRTTGQPNGPRRWNLRVRYREGGEIREALIIVAATIRNEVTVQPSILALYVRDVLRQEVVVTDQRSPPLKVTGVKASSPAIRVTVKAAEGGVTRLLLEATASALADGRQDAVLNIYTDDPQYSPLQLPIVLTRGVKSAVAVAPRQIEARISASQPVAAALVRLRPADGHKVAIESADTDDPGVTCTWAAGPGTGATLKVRVDGRRLDKRDGPRTVRVRLVEPPGEILTIPVSIEKAP